MNEMKFREAWRASKIPYVELAYRSAELTRGSMQGFGRDPYARFRSILRNAKMSKFVFTIFICIGSVIPFALYGFNSSPSSFVSALSLSLALSLAYLVLYFLQILPSFSGAEPYILLQTMPLGENEFSLVTMLSFFRTFDYLALGAILVPVLAVWGLTGSVLAAALMLGAGAMNVVFAVAIGLWLSRLFYRNITRGGRSKSASLARVLLLVTWGLTVLGIGFSFQFLTYFLPYMNQLISGNLSRSGGILLSIVHPFAIGLAISSILFPKFFSSTSSGGGVALFAYLSYIATAAYVGLAFVSGRRTLRSISSISHGQGINVVREEVKEFSLKVRKPLSAYATKDLRVASKNPSTAFLFALPVFEIIIVVLTASGIGASQIAAVISATSIGSFFTLMTAPILLNTEAKGLDYVISLPIDAMTVINTKSLIATLFYLPVPVALTVLQLVSRDVFSFSILIPFVETLAISAATTAQVALFVKSSKGVSGTERHRTRKSSSSLQSAGFSIMSGSNIGLWLAAIVIAIIIIGVPLIAYGVAVSLTSSISASIGIMALSATVEFVLVQAVARSVR
jgi:predicted permease